MIFFVRHTCLLLFLVVLAREAESQVVTITSQPLSPLVVLEGETVPLQWTYTIQGSTLPRVQFGLAGSPIAFVEAFSGQTPIIRGEYAGRLTVNVTGTNATITFIAVNRTDTNSYAFFVIANSGDFARKDVEIIVQYPPSLTTRAQNQVLLEGDGPVISLSCIADGEPTPNITWTEVFDNGSDSDVLFTGEDFNELANNRTNEGIYRCKASNGIGSDVNHTVNVTINFKPENFQFTIQGKNANICKGDTINITCSAFGRPAVHTYQLLKDDTLLSESSNAKLFWSNATKSGGVYTCVANNTVATANATRSVIVNMPSSIQRIDDREVVEGGNVTLVCSAPCIPEPSVSWSKVGGPLLTNVSELVFENISRQDAGEYTCEAISPFGNASESARIDVQFAPEMVQLVLSDTTVCGGDFIIFNCSANSNPAVHTYQLYVNGTMVIESSDTGVLNRTVTMGGVFVYKCMVNNTVGTAMSANVSVTVNVPSSINPIDHKVIIEGEDVNLTCIATGDPLPTVSWLTSNGTRINDTELVIRNISRDEAGQYRCEATNFCNTATELVTVDVQFAPEMVQLIPSDTTVCLGDVIILSCSANSNPAVHTYQKFVNGSGVNESSETGVWNRTMTMGGLFIYKCVVNNTIGTEMSGNVSINVNVPSSIHPIDDKVITEGQDVTLTCIATGIPQPTVSWLTSNGTRINETELVIRNISRKEAGEYRCEASNFCNTATELVTVDVQFAPEMVQLEVSDTTVCRGDVITLNCSANSNPAVHTYQKYVIGSTVIESSDRGVWNRIMTTGGVFVYKCMVNNTVGTAMSANVSVSVNVPSSIDAIENEVITEGGNVNLTCSATGVPQPTVFWLTSNGTRIDQTTLVITDINRKESGEYRCEATNPCGSANFSAEIDVQYAPEITHISGTQTLNRGNSVTLNCAADGNPEANITWTRLTDNTVVEMPLTIAGEQDQATYRCNASNSVGFDTRDTSIVVNFPAAIVPLEDRVVVQEGGNYTLFCNVSGTPPPSVMWTHVPTNHKHRNETWFIADIKFRDLGEYRCDASNMHGNATDSVNIEFPGGNCSEVCTGGTKCRFFGTYPLCLCDIGKTGTNCEETETLKKKVEVGVEFTNEVFKPEYENLDDEVTKNFTGRVEQAVKDEMTETDLIQVKVTRLREGSVIADLELTFNRSVSASAVGASIDEAVSDGRLGDLAVGQVIIDGKIPETPTESEPPSVEKGLIYGLVIGVLTVAVASGVLYFIIKRKRRQGGDQPLPLEEPEVIQAPSHLNAAIEMETDIANDLNTGNARHYMELDEVRDSQGRSQETSTYLEISEYAPLHPRTRSWEVSRDNVIIEKVVGQGSFGQVAQGKASELPLGKGTLTVAIKMLKKNAGQTERKDLLSELDVMKKLKPHPHVIKLLGCVTESDPIFVIIEYVPYGDLLGYLRKSRGLNDTYFKDPDIKPQTILSSLQLMKISWQVANGMSYLSSKKIIHRDLAARNVLVGEGETCKVTDFGMARDVHLEDVYERKTRGRIPVKWTAYEALMFRRYTTKSDVWSFGIVLYEIFTIGGSPYPRIDARKLAQLLDNGYRMPKPNHLDDALYQIMLNCWRKEPDDRPSFEHLQRELKRMENQHKRLINMKDYDKKLYENVEDLMF